MTLTNPDRKRLWGKAANRCAVCRDLLTRPAAGGDSEAIVGEEAHIIGSRPGSARYTLMDPRDCDSYENRILLCPNHQPRDRQPTQRLAGQPTTPGQSRP